MYGFTLLRSQYLSCLDVPCMVLHCYDLNICLVLMCHVWFYIATISIFVLSCCAMYGFTLLRSQYLSYLDVPCMVLHCYDLNICLIWMCNLCAIREGPVFSDSELIFCYICPLICTIYSTFYKKVKQKK